MKNKIVQVVVGLPVEGPFDYRLPEDLPQDVYPGQRVLVSFQFKKLIGFIVGIKTSSGYNKLKDIISVLDPQPVLSDDLLCLTRDVARYYGCTWGEAIETALPSILRKSKKPVCFDVPTQAQKQKTDLSHQLFFYQRESDYWPLIQHSIAKVLSLGQSVIVLVPEVFLIERYALNIEQVSGKKPIVLDKQLAGSKEIDAFCLLKQNAACVVIGTRSAVFAPVHALGLIVVFQEENSSYKQDQTPFYDAREVALMRAEHNDAAIYFCSQAPTPERMYWASQKNITVQRNFSQSNKTVELIDLSDCKPLKSAVMSLPVQYAVEKALQKKERILLLINKKGFSSFGICGNCGYTLKCPRCDIYLTYSYHSKVVYCRLCSHKQPKPEFCPECKKTYIHFKGAGIEKLESEVARYFPQARIVRFQDKAQDVPYNADILIATQAVFGLFEKMTFSLSVAMQIDAQLDRADYKAGHNAFALLSQMCNMTERCLLIQTRLRNNYCLCAVKTQDPDIFYDQEMKFRKDLALRPFAHLAQIIIRGVLKDKVQQQAEDFFQVLKDQNAGKNVEIFEPQAAAMAKLRDQHRFVIVIKAKSVNKITGLMRKALGSFRKKSGIVITINLDP